MADDHAEAAEGLYRHRRPVGPRDLSLPSSGE